MIIKGFIYPKTPLESFWGQVSTIKDSYNTVANFVSLYINTLKQTRIPTTRMKQAQLP